MKICRNVLGCGMIIAAFAGTDAQDLVQNGGFEFEGTNPMHSSNVRSHWHGWTSVRMKMPENEKKELLSQTRHEAVNEDPATGTAALALITPKNEYIKSTGHISNTVVQTVVLPVRKAAGRYRLSAKLRGIPGSSLMIFIIPLKKDGKKYTTGGKTITFAVRLVEKWQDLTKDFALPADTAAFRLEFSLYGSGSAYVDDVQVVPVKQISR